MNKRIKEIAEQTNAFIIEPEHAKIGSVSEVSFDNYSDFEKFAELIVRECQLRVERYIYECGEVASMPDAVIMKHFGIKE
jgi:hypothetical protein